MAVEAEISTGSRNESRFGTASRIGSRNDSSRLFSTGSRNESRTVSRNGSRTTSRNGSKDWRDGDRSLARLSWKDLTVVVNNAQVVLHHLSGLAEPGRLLAVMGPSGSGKSTLLDALAGRLAKNTTVDGEILVNGRKTRLSYGTAAYLAQEVQLLGTLTVYETVYYSAKLRYPDSTTEKEIRRIVKNIIADVGLTGSMHTAIGNWHKRGVSGGEKRRVSIAIELLTCPRLLFLDEPTSGLDSASSYHVISTLKNLARRGRTVMLSIHQPSSEVFGLFDDLCLLSGGQQVYFGTLPTALQFFANSGYPCSPLRNPSDHYLLCVNTDFDAVHTILKTSIVAHDQDLDAESMALPVEADSQEMFSSVAAKKYLTEAFAVSEEKKRVDDTIQQMDSLETDELDQKGSLASFIRQSSVLTRRSFLNMNRDFGYYWLRLAMYGVLCIAIGTIYYKAGQSFTAIQARAACVSFIVAFLTFMAVGGFPSFIEDMKVFTAERMNGHYGVGAFVIGNTLSSMPFLFLISVVSSSIAYFLVDLHSGFGHFLYFVLVLFAALLAIESLMMAIASLVPNFLMGIILGAGIQGMFILVAGFFRLPDDLPDPVWRYPMHYIATHPYAFQGMLQNDFQGLRFQNLYPGDPPLTGEYILQYSWDIQVNRSKWWNLAILFLMTPAYRAIFYILIRASEIVFPAIRIFISKKFFSNPAISTEAG